MAKKEHFQLPQEELAQLSPEELALKRAVLNEPMPQVSAGDIRKACEAAGEYLPGAKKGHTLDIVFWRLLFFSLNSRMFLFWLACAFVLAGCAVYPHIAGGNGASFSLLLASLAPVPFLSFAISELCQRDKNLMEVEKTCRYAPEHILAARLTVCMLMNACILLAAGFILNHVCEDVLRMYLCAFTSMFLVGMVSLWLMSVTDNVLPLTALLAVWVVVGMALTSNEKAAYYVEQISSIPIGAVLCFSLILFAGSLPQSARKIYA